MSKLSLEEALDNFKNATAELSIAWDNSDGDIFGDTYPKYLPDFAQFVFDVDAMEPQQHKMTDDEVIAYALAHAVATLDLSAHDDARLTNLLYAYGDKVGVDVPEGDEYQRAVLHRFDPERVPDFPLAQED